MNNDFIKQRVKEIYGAQENAADKIGISRKHLSQFLNGNANVTQKTLEDIANAIDCDLVMVARGRVSE